MRNGSISMDIMNYGLREKYEQLKKSGVRIKIMFMCPGHNLICMMRMKKKGMIA